MRKAAIAVLGFLMSSAVFLACSGAMAEGLAPEILVDLKTVSDAAMSPDGQYIAYIVRTPRAPDEEPGSAHSEIWVVSTFQRAHRSFVTGPGDAYGAQWSPDGEHIAFLSDRPSTDRSAGAEEDAELGETQVYAISISGGEARQLTSAETSVRGFKWSPDGSHIAFVASDPKTAEEKEAEEGGEDWTVVDKNLKPRRLWSLDVSTREAHRVTTSDISVWDFSWSPGGDRLVISATDLPKTDDSMMFAQLHIVPASGGEPVQLCKTWGKLGPPRWSPDGERIAFRAAVSANDPSTGTIFAVEVPSGEPVNLTPGIEATVTSVRWINKETLAFAAIEGTGTSLYTMGADGEDRRKISKDGLVFFDFSFSADRKQAAVVANSPEHPNELYLWTRGGLFGRGAGDMERLTFLNDVLDGVEFAQQEVVSWTSSDGLEIEGVLIKPLGYQEGTRYPLIVQVHGGPEGVRLNGWTSSYVNWSQCLAARGYVVLMPNFRGSIGRGVDFCKSDHRDLGGMDFQDILSGIDYLVDGGLVEAARVGIGGSSYGGFISGLAATAHSDRFVAAVNHAGIANWFSFTGETDIPYEMCITHWDFWVYDNPVLIWERSPISHVNSPNTPSLIVHGAEDRRVPPGQSWELYTAFKVKGVDTELVLYPREGHGFRERAHQLDYLTRVIGWYDKHLMGGM
jgi:dipeptidyl aminopeptidase/acylaminoacyl peptidase